LGKQNSLDVLGALNIQIFLLIGNGTKNHFIHSILNAEYLSKDDLAFDNNLLTEDFAEKILKNVIEEDSVGNEREDLEEIGEFDIVDKLSFKDASELINQLKNFATSSFNRLLTSILNLENQFMAESKELIYVKQSTIEDYLIKD
jgi:hypothetical protein